MRRSITLPTLLIVLSLILTSCTNAHPRSTAPAEHSPPLSGFGQVYLAPVAAELSADIGQISYGQTARRPVSDADLARKSADLHGELEQAFARYFSLTDGPGPGVLIVEPLLLQLASTRPTQADLVRNPRVDFSATVYGGGAEVVFTF